MLQITTEFKQAVVEALLIQRDNFTGTDGNFAKQWGINTAVYSRLKKGDLEKVVKDTQWLNLGRQLEISLVEKKLKTVRTEVLTTIEEDIDFCQAHSKAKIFVDESEIGKTHAAKYLARNRTNCFYIDCSESKTKQLFIRSIAKTLGIEHDGKYAEVKALIKYYLKYLPNPLIILDEAGDLEYKAFLELKEFWNATEGACGWYMIGADGLKAIIEKGIRNKKVGYREIFSRFSSRYTSVTPIDIKEKKTWYKGLVTQVISANLEDKSKLNEIVTNCIRVENNIVGGLRRAESLMILHS